MLAPISWRTPPRHYGPWEQVTSLLTEALVARGVDVTLFAKPGCAYCARAKALLHEHAIGFEEIVLNRDVNLRSLRAATGKDTVPQLFVAGKRIGGWEEIEVWLATRERIAA
jgi:glutaredoxin-like protein